MGLDHIDDRSHIMFPILSTQEDRYQPGDLHGLHMLGATQGC